MYPVAPERIWKWGRHEIFAAPLHFFNQSINQ